MGAGTSKARPLSIERLCTPSRFWPCPQAAHFLGPKPWRPRSLGVLITDLKPALCFPSFSPPRKNSLFEFVSPHHLHCPGELLTKARGENLFRDENATVRGGGEVAFCTDGKEVCIPKTNWSVWPSAGFRTGGWDIEWTWKRALRLQGHELKEEL